MGPAARLPARNASRSNGLRIALVVESMDSGVARLIDLQANGLDRLGHDVHVLHPIDRIDSEVLSRLQAHPRIRCAAINMKRRLQAKDITAGLQLRRYLKRHGPFDIVHGHSSKGGALVRLFCLGLPGIRVYTPHAFYTLDPDLAFSSRFFFRAVEYGLGLLCTKVICSSVLERQHARSLGIGDGRLAVINNAIAPPALSEPTADRFGFPSDASLIAGFVGRLEHQKGLDILLRALALAALRDAGLYLVVIGSGSLERELKALAADLGVLDRVRWLGRQPVHAYLTSFDTLVMPSRYEGFSLIPLDAMHAALPIICTPVGGIEECVVDGETGIVVPIADPEALAAALVDLSRSDTRRRTMGAGAKARARLFTVDRMVEATERLYIETLASRRTAASPQGRRDLGRNDVAALPEQLL